MELAAIREGRRKTIDILAVALFFSSTLFFFGPCQLYFTNSLEFPFSFLELFPILAVTFAIVCVFVSAALLPLISSSVFQKAVSLSLAISFLIWLQGNILIWRCWVLDGRAVDWSRYAARGLAESGLWIACTVVAVARSAFFSRIARTTSIMFISAELVSAVFLGLAAPEAEFKEYAIDEMHKFRFSSNRNVIILVLDAFQTDVFHEIIDGEKGYRDAYKGFVYFRNAVGGFVTTYPSVPLILTGRYYDNSLPMQAFIKDAFLSPGSIPKVLRDAGFLVDLFPDRHCEIYCSAKIASNIVTKRASTETIREGAALLYELALFRYAPYPLKRHIYGRHGRHFAYRRKPSRRKEMPIPNHSSLDDLRFVAEMESSARADGGESTFKFYHWWGMHPPFCLNEHLEVVALGSNYHRACITHAKGVLHLVQRFLTALKKIGVYDNSMILIVGDHGLWSRDPLYIPKDMRADHDRNRDCPKDLLIGTALPLILVKPFDANGKMSVSDAPVCLHDISRTILSAFGLQGGSPGVSMLANEGKPRTRRFFQYTWKHAYFERDYLSAMQEFVALGHSWFGDSWRATGRSLKPEQ